MDSRDPETLLELCGALHGSYTGAADPLSDEETKRFRRRIREKLGRWRAGHDMTAAYDEAVRALCEAALAEWRDPEGEPHFAEPAR